MREVFIQYIKNNNFDKIIFEDILNDLNSKNQLDLLERIIINYPNLNITNLNLDLFNDRYIDCFGIDFLCKNITTLKKIYLDYGLKDEEIKEKMFTINNLDISFDNINSKLLLSNIINNDNIINISKLLKNKCFSELICKYCIDDYEYFNIIKKTNNKNSVYYKLITILFKFFEKKEYEKFIEILNSNNINEYISFFENIELSWFGINCSFDNLIEVFNKNKNLFSEINKIKNIKEYLKIYFFDNQINVSNVKELKNIKNLRYEDFRFRILNENNINEIKNLFVKCYFNMDITNFKLKIDNIKENLQDGLTLKEEDIYFFELLESVFSLNDKFEIIFLFDKLLTIPNIYRYIDYLEEEQKKYCFNDIARSLTNIGKYPQIIEFDGQDFNFLIHRTKGYGNRELAKKISNDPSLWDKNKFEDSYISTSMITQDYFGCVPGSGTILAFNNISNEDILDMGSEDIYYSIKHCKNNIRTTKSKIMTSKNLIKNSNKLYNEVVIKRNNNKTNIMPSAVVVFDKVTKNDIKVSKYFNVPIYLINTEKYLSKMLEKCDYYLNVEDYDSYYDFRIKIANSFANNREVLQKYFNVDELNKNTNLVIDKISKNLEKSKNNEEKKILINQLKNVINVNKKINSIVMYNDITSQTYKFDEREIQKRLKLYLNF